jgi:hypothetical protein
MTDQLFPLEEPTSDVEFVGFDGGQIVEPVPVDDNRDTPAVAKRPRRRAKRPPKRVAVRIWFDERELRKLNGRAAEAGVALTEYLRRRALRDPRVRARSPVPAGSDLFARAEIVQTTMVRLSAPLSPEMEERITTYFCPADGFVVGPMREGPVLNPVSRPMRFARLGQFLSVWFAARWPRHSAIPPAGI